MYMVYLGLVYKFMNIIDILIIFIINIINIAKKCHLLVFLDFRFFDSNELNLDTLPEDLQYGKSYS